MPKQNYNPMNVLGLQPDLDDMDVVKQYNLDPSLAYTPELNQAAIKAQFNQNMVAAKKAGMNEAAAEEYAKEYKTKAERLVEEAMSTMK